MWHGGTRAAVRRVRIPEALSSSRGLSRAVGAARSRRGPSGRSPPGGRALRSAPPAPGPRGAAATQRPTQRPAGPAPPALPFWQRRVTNFCHMTVTPNGVGRAELAAARGRRCAEPGARRRGAAAAPQDAAHPVSEAFQQKARPHIPGQGRERRLRLQVKRRRGRPPPPAPSSGSRSAGGAVRCRAAPLPRGAAAIRRPVLFRRRRAAPRGGPAALLLPPGRPCGAPGVPSGDARGWGKGGGGGGEARPAPCRSSRGCEPRGSDLKNVQKKEGKRPSRCQERCRVTGEICHDLTAAALGLPLQQRGRGGAVCGEPRAGGASRGSVRSCRVETAPFVAVKPSAPHWETTQPLLGWRDRKRPCEIVLKFSA